MWYYTLTVGASGDTILIPSGATINNQGSAVNFGPTGAVSWNTTKRTTGFTAVAGIGYFCDTTSAAFTVTLPATPSAGAVIGITDYANTFATNNITVARNGSNIGGLATNATLLTNGIAVTFVYVDSTQGWIVTDSGNRSDLPTPQFITATGGTITTSGDYKIHTFTGPSTFTVSSAGNSLGSNSVDYLVVAGGGGGGGDLFSTAGGAGGAGGFRYSNSTFPVSGAPGAPLASATALPVTATAYPITVGGGGAGGTSPTFPIRGTAGSPSIFSTITSAGGGEGNGAGGPMDDTAGGNGGSGGGARNAPAGTGNTPPVSPSQGNPGGASGVGAPLYSSGGGGGAMAAGSNGSAPVGGGPGGVGSGLPNAFGTSGQPSGGYYYFSGGGGGGIWTNVPAPQAAGPYGQGGLGGGGNGGQYTSPGTGVAGVAATANTGGGGGGASGGPSAPNKTNGGSGGSGIVVIRYKYQ
jgi:hypothetical protein